MAPSEVLQAVESAAPTTPDKELEHEVNNNNEEFETPKKGGSPPAARPKYVAPNVLYKPTRPMMEEMDIAKQVENPGAAPNTILVKRVADTSTAALTVLTDYLGQVDPQVKVGLHEQMVRFFVGYGSGVVVVGRGIVWWWLAGPEAARGHEGNDEFAPAEEEWGGYRSRVEAA